MRPFRSLYPGGFLTAALPGSSRRPWPSPNVARLGSPWPSRAMAHGAAGFASRYGPVARSPRGGLDAGLRRRAFPPDAASLLPAAWCLPGPDFHRQVDASLCSDQVINGTTSKRWAHRQPPCKGEAEARPDLSRYPPASIWCRLRTCTFLANAFGTAALTAPSTLGSPQK